MNKKWIVLFLAGLAIAGGIYYYFFRTVPNTSELTLYGNVEVRQVDLAFKVPGKIDSLLHEEGDHVKKGELLGTLDTTSYQADRRKVDAEMMNLRDQLDSAQANYSRRETLYQAGAIAREELDTYRKARDMASAQLEAAVQMAAVSDDTVENTKLYAPDDGIITVRAKEVGSVVSSSSIVYTLSLERPLWIRTYVDEAHLGTIKPGMKVTILTDSIDPTTNQKKTYTGHIGYISPNAEFTPKTVQTESLRPDLVYRVRIYVEGDAPFLRQGMPVTAKVKLVEAVK